MIKIGAQMCEATVRCKCEMSFIIYLKTVINMPGYLYTAFILPFGCVRTDVFIMFLQCGVLIEM
jgi:hypothetical protein